VAASRFCLNLPIAGAKEYWAGCSPAPAAGGGSHGCTGSSGLRPTAPVRAPAHTERGSGLPQAGRRKIPPKFPPPRAAPRRRNLPGIFPLQFPPELSQARFFGSRVIQPEILAARQPRLKRNRMRRIREVQRKFGAPSLCRLRKIPRLPVWRPASRDGSRPLFRLSAEIITCIRDPRPSAPGAALWFLLTGRRFPGLL
jgi:hypothetical protein